MLISTELYSCLSFARLRFKIGPIRVRLIEQKRSNKQSHDNGVSVDPILIVGAGPTGLLLAIELARRGVPHVLIDQRPKPMLWDRAAVVKTRTLEILAALGLSEQFLARGTA